MSDMKRLIMSIANNNAQRALDDLVRYEERFTDSEIDCLLDYIEMRANEQSV